MAQDWFAQATTPQQAPQPQRRGRIIADPYRARDEGRKDEAAANERDRIRLAEENARLQREAGDRQRDAQNRGNIPEGYRLVNGVLQAIPGYVPKDSSNTLTAEQKGKLQAQAAGARGLLRRIEEVQSRFARDFAGKGSSGLREYLPGQMRPENQEFNDAGRALMGDLAAAYGLTAQQQNTPAELEIRFGPFIPKAGDRDSVIRSKIARLKEVAQMQEGQALQQMGQSLPQRDSGKPAAPVGPQANALTPTNVIDFAAGLTGGKYELDETGGVTYDGQPVALPAEIANSPQFAAAYRAKFGEAPPLAVDVSDNSPSGMSPLEQARDTTLGAIDATVRGGADMLSIGLADPVAAALAGPFNDKTFAQNLTAQRGISAADEEVNPWARVGGQIAGSIAPFYGAARLGAAAMPSRPLVGSAVAETGVGAAYGGISTPEDPVMGALVGGGATLVGNQIGQRVLSPIVERALSRSAGQTDPVLRALSRKSNDVDLANVSATLTDARRLGVPAALADADPRFRALAGSATRLAPAAREFAEQTIFPRGRGQAERAIGAIERDFGPTVDMGQASDDLINSGRAASSGLYDEAYRAPVVSTPELESLLATPAGRQALSRARTIAANERRDPKAMGFALDADGEVILRPVAADEFAAHAKARTALDEAHQGTVAANLMGGDIKAARQRVTEARAAFREAEDRLKSAQFSTGTVDMQPGYTTQTLDYVKRGLDDILEESRDPITRRLHLDEAGRAINDVRHSLVREIDQYNPQYAEARKAYEIPVKQRDALNAGYKAVGPRTGQDTLGRMTAGLDDAQMEQFGTGYRTGMSEQVERMRFSGNPYDAVYGTPDQVAKVGALFPEGAANFARQAEVEQLLARTQTETLGGSPTAGRQAADAMFAPGLMAHAGVETAAGMLTGVPPIGAITNVARATLGDRMRMGLGGSERATSIAQLLLEPSPSQALSTVERILLQQEISARARGASSMAGASLALPLIPVE